MKGSADAMHPLVTMISEKNQTRKNVLFSIIRASFGLMIFGVGVCFTLHAGIGVAPWDTFQLGLAHVFGIQYGTATMGVGALLLLVNGLMKEPIGYGMVLDTLIVGKFVDLLNWLEIVPYPNSFPAQCTLLIAGLFIEGFSQFIYMGAAIGCGPRDGFLIALSKRFHKVPIGAVSVGIMVTVTTLGWLMDGPIGIGTLLCAFLTGPIMQLDFTIVHFDATGVKHQNIVTSTKILFSIHKRHRKP
jgi:uncharacterized membrane protein YczE